MNYHHTKNKGDLGVFKAQVDLHNKGFWVSRPLTENAPFDLIITKDYTSKTIQVKYRTLKNGKLSISFKSVWSDINGVHTKPIDLKSIDLFCVYCPDTDKCYYFESKSFLNKKFISLRINDSKNKQIKNINFAEKYTQLALEHFSEKASENPLSNSIQLS